jgi:hypothetical protein
MTLAASVAALTLAATPAVAAAPATGPQPASPPATARAKIVKPLVLTATRNLDFGTITVGNVNAGGETVSISQSNVVTCGSSGQLVCSGNPLAATYGVTGTNNQVVKITGTASDLTNANDNSKIQFTPNAPATLTLTNAGAPGTPFSLGGSIIVTPSTTDGVYTGNIDVTVDYQ